MPGKQGYTLAQLHQIQQGCHPLIPGLGTSYGYVPSLAAGVVFCILFGLSFGGHFYQSIRRRRWTSYVLVAGAVTEIIGWGARAHASQCPLNGNDFLIQIVTLIIAPVFFSAAAYITLGALIRIVGRQSSLLSPRLYVILFSSFDVISLIVQAIGGGSASVASNRGTSTKVGTDIMVGGILFQMATMVVFVLFLLDFVRRAGAAVRTEKEEEREERGEQKPGATKKVIYAMAFSITCIFIRSIYRSIELLQGWSGYLITHERYFIALDGAMMVLAIAAYNVFDPAGLLPKVHLKEAVVDEEGPVRDEMRGGESVSEVEVEAKMGRRHDGDGTGSERSV